MRHCDLSESLTRPPGCPPSRCGGELDPVDGSGNVLGHERADAAPIFDDALRGEGEFGDLARLDLYRCRACRQTLVVARGPGEADRMAGWLRNDWGPKPSRDPAPLAATDPSPTRRDAGSSTRRWWPRFGKAAAPDRRARRRCDDAR